MKKLRFLGAYIVPVGETIDINSKLTIPQIEVKLTECSNKTGKINYGGIDVGKCTQVGEHKTSFNELINK